MECGWFNVIGFATGGVPGVDVSRLYSIPCITVHIVIGAGL